MSKRKKVFYSCSRYPDCTYAIWDKPVNKKCPACDHPFMLEKNTKARGEHLICPSCKHIAEANVSAEKTTA
jgi:DNA topoisomerase-1